MKLKELVVITDKDIITTVMPLFPHYEETEIAKLDGYSISLSNEKPVAYAMFVGEETKLQLIGAELVEKHCEFLGVL